MADEDNMVPQQQINDFVTRLQQAAGANLESVILYGSAATAEFVAEFSDVNLLCILGETSFPALAKVAPVMEWWNKKKHPTPLVMTLGELSRSADVFAIELLDMHEHHRVLFGNDALNGLTVPLHLHRAQVEYELREKLILLRQRLLLAAGDKSKLWDLLLSSRDQGCRSRGEITCERFTSTMRLVLPSAMQIRANEFHPWTSAIVCPAYASGLRSTVTLWS